MDYYIGDLDESVHIGRVFPQSDGRRPIINLPSLLSYGMDQGILKQAGLWDLSMVCMDFEWFVGYPYPQPYYSYYDDALSGVVDHHPWITRWDWTFVKETEVIIIAIPEEIINFQDIARVITHDPICSDKRGVTISSIDLVEKFEVTKGLDIVSYHKKHPNEIPSKTSFLGEFVIDGFLRASYHPLI